MNNKSSGYGKSDIRMDILIIWSFISIWLVTFIDIEIYHTLVNNIEEHYDGSGARATGIRGIIIFTEIVIIFIHNFTKYLITWLLGVFAIAVLAPKFNKIVKKENNKGDSK